MRPTNQPTHAQGQQNNKTAAHRLAIARLFVSSITQIYIYIFQLYIHLQVVDRPTTQLHKRKNEESKRKTKRKRSLKGADNQLDAP